MRGAAGIGPTDAWDLAFVHHVGFHSQRQHEGPRSAWPFDRSLGHAALASAARADGLLVKRPGEGDIVLYGSGGPRRPARAGIVVALNVESLDDADRSTFHCVTIECDAAGPDAGVCVREAERPIALHQGDLLIRWALSDGRQARLDTRRLAHLRSARAGWEYDEQLARCA